MKIIVLGELKNGGCFYDKENIFYVLLGVIGDIFLVGFLFLIIE